MFTRLPNDVEGRNLRKQQGGNIKNEPQTYTPKNNKIDSEWIDKFGNIPLVSKSIILPRYGPTKQELIEELLEIPYKGMTFQKESTCEDNKSIRSEIEQPSFWLLNDFLQKTDTQKKNKHHHNSMVGAKNTMKIIKNGQKHKIPNQNNSQVKKELVIDYFLKDKQVSHNSDISQISSRSQIQPTIKYSELIKTQKTAQSPFSSKYNNKCEPVTTIQSPVVQKLKPKQNKSQGIQTSLNNTEKSIQCSLVHQNDESNQYSFSLPSEQINLSQIIKSNSNDKSSEFSIKQIQSSLQERKSIRPIINQNQFSKKQVPNSQQNSRDKLAADQTVKKSTVVQKPIQKLIENKQLQNQKQQKSENQIPRQQHNSKINQDQTANANINVSSNINIVPNKSINTNTNLNKPSTLSKVQTKPQINIKPKQQNPFEPQQPQSLTQQQTVKPNKNSKRESINQQSVKPKLDQTSQQKQQKQPKQEPLEPMPIKKSVDLLEEKKKRDKLKLQQQTNKKLSSIFDIPSKNTESDSSQKGSARIDNKNKEEEKQNPVLNQKPQEISLSDMRSFNSKDVSRRVYQDFANYDKDEHDDFDSFENYQSSSDSYDKRKYVLEQVKQEDQNQESLAQSKMKKGFQKENVKVEENKNNATIEEEKSITPSVEESIVEQYSIDENTQQKPLEVSQTKIPKMQRNSKKEQNDYDDSFDLEHFIVKDIKSNVDQLKSKMSKQVSEGSNTSMTNVFEDFNKQIKYKDFKSDIDQLKNKIAVSNNL